MNQIEIPLIKDNKRNRWVATMVVLALSTIIGYSVRILHELDQSSQRTEVQIQRFLEWRQNNDEHKRDIEQRIDALSLMIVDANCHAHEQRDQETTRP